MMAMRVSSLPGICHPGTIPHTPPPHSISPHPTASCFTGEAQGVQEANQRASSR